MPVFPGLRRQKNQEFKVMFDCLANAGQHMACADRGSWEARSSWNLRCRGGLSHLFPFYNLWFPPLPAPLPVVSRGRRRRRHRAISVPSHSPRGTRSRASTCLKQR